MEASLIASGQKGKAHDILAAIRTLKQIEQEHRQATSEERQTLARFGGFGAVALSLFPDPVTGRYKDDGWQTLGEELQALLTPEEYDSAKRTTFTAFYTSPTVMHAMHEALRRLGVPQNATVLEPGCGIGNFMAYAPEGMHFLGVEMDSLSGRIARALHPGQDIRIENFRDTRLPAHRIDAVIGNVPFADIKFAFQGQRLALHDYFLVKSLDALKPGGVLAVVTSHYTLDKQNPDMRQQLAEKADFLGAIRLPADAFKREGTAVVTDVLFLKKRAPGEAARHTDDGWLQTEPLTIEGVDIPINRYFLHHPDMVLGRYTRQDRLYGGEANYSLVSNGELAMQLSQAIERLPEGVFTCAKSPGFSAAVEQSDTSRTLPPLERHVTEGSFFVGDDKSILQVQDGEAVPVTHGNCPLRADGTMMGQRLAALIGLRDQARRVLQSQNEGWDADLRQEARQRLNLAHDRFVSHYGAINKTSLSAREDGTVTRRMPNLVKFRDDPDAMLVMALEDYDEEADKAKKADIMERDVVGRAPPVTEVRSAEEGLLVSLNHRGKVDLPYISTLYHAPESQIIAELGDLLYQDPAGEWQTADQYLSGNVRAKLKAAEEAGLQRNVEALAKVQPEDLLPGHINANLGAPWIPESDIRDFAADLFKVTPDAVTVTHMKKEALWSVSGDLSASKSVAVTADYGTSRINGITLLEQAMNLKSPTIYDVIRHPDGSEERKVNQDDTLAAREKQQQIKDAFKQWIWTDQDRCERLVRLYNDGYNNIRLRTFDGSHLTFPGMNPHFTLRQHQKDGVWRVMCDGNTLLAHCVGSGKTALTATAAMKMRQAGLVRKPIIAVPNHMLEQWGREFMQLYPNAKLLIAGKNDFTKERRKLLTAKIASRDWDAIIVTHSSFERIGMSPEYQAAFLRELIEEYEALLIDAESMARASGDRGQHNIVKTLEKQKENYEEKLQDIMAHDKKDDGLVFDELGVDHIFIDESQQFKRLAYPTKMDRVAGIQTGGSERAMDLFMKCRYLHHKHPGHGVSFASATPITNTMAEVYTLQRYLDPDGLRERGIDHFDAWAASFGEVIDAMEISPDGRTLRSRSRFAKFVNLPELQQMFHLFADVKTADMLNLPSPKVDVISIPNPMSDEQKERQDHLVARYEAIRSGKVKPWEDNALAITTDGRKLALDPRLLSENAADFEHCKVRAVSETIYATWEETTPTRATQLVFCDLGVHPTPWGFSIYDEIIDSLVKKGIPRQEIAAIGDASTDAQKQTLIDQVNAGKVRVLIGSTEKMGTGTNAQKRLIANHDIDCPWRPDQVEQRKGRIARQGNMHTAARIYRYLTEGSFDAYQWQAVETKARFINQFMTGDLSVREAEDIGDDVLSYAEMKAIASGNPAVLTLAETDAEIKRLHVLKKHHADEQYIARKALRELPENIARLEGRIASLGQDMATAEAHTRDPLTIGGQRRDRKDALELLGERLKDLPKVVTENRRFSLGTYRGLTFSLCLYAYHTPEIGVEGAAMRLGTLARDAGPQAVLNAVERTVGGYADEVAKSTRDLEIARSQFRDYETRLGGRFAHTAYLEALTKLRSTLEAALSSPTQACDTESIVASIKALKAAHTIEAVPEPMVRRKAASIEEAVTTRILHRAKEAEAAPEVHAEAVPEPAERPLMSVVPEKTAEIVQFKTPMPEMPVRKPSHRRREVQDTRQMSFL